MLIGSVIAVLSATTVQANVIYNWHPTIPGPYLTATGGELVITDAAYRSGSIDFHVGDPYYPGGYSPGILYDKNFRITNSPVVSASLTFDFTDGSGRVAPGVFVEPGSQIFSDREAFGSTLAFNNDGTLSGYLFLYGVDTEVAAGGTQGDWGTSRYLSDYFAGEQCVTERCDVGSGYWQLSSGPIGVPEPPVWPVFGLGVLGLFGLLRLRRNA